MPFDKKKNTSALMQFTQWQIPKHCKSVNPTDSRSFKKLIVFGVWILLWINCCFHINVIQLTLDFKVPFVIIILNCPLPILFVAMQIPLFCIKLQLFHPVSVKTQCEPVIAVKLQHRLHAVYACGVKHNRICGLLSQWAIEGKQKKSTNVKLVILIKNYIHE